MRRRRANSNRMDRHVKHAASNGRPHGVATSCRSRNLRASKRLSVRKVVRQLGCSVSTPLTLTTMYLHRLGKRAFLAEEHVTPPADLPRIQGNSHCFQSLLTDLLSNERPSTRTLSER